MSDARPIGVFDSGFGGLTVFKALARRMPAERLIYFGDTAHLPYGSKSKEAVARFSATIASFLIERDIKMLVVACNTASAMALGALRAAASIPILGVIEPGARAAAAAGTKDVGIIATEGTIASGAYQAALKRLIPGARPLGVACPLFVPLVEEGWWSKPVAAQIAAEYLAPFKRRGIDALILGCTHYPLLKPALRLVMGPRVRFIDSAEETAREAEEIVRRRGLERRGAASPPARGPRGRGREGPPRHRFFVSDGPERFLRLARRLLGVKVGKVEVYGFD